LGSCGTFLRDLIYDSVFEGAPLGVHYFILLVSLLEIKFLEILELSVSKRWFVNLEKKLFRDLLLGLKVNFDKERPTLELELTISFSYFFYDWLGWYLKFVDFI
jgi:hypothetical protein